MADKTCLGVTPGGKEIYSQNKLNRSVLELYFKDGGELPDELKGAYSDRASAQRAVDTYLSRPFSKKEVKK